TIVGPLDSLAVGGVGSISIGCTLSLPTLFLLPPLAGTCSSFVSSAVGGGTLLLPDREVGIGSLSKLRFLLSSSNFGTELVRVGPFTFERRLGSDFLNGMEVE